MLLVLSMGALGVCQAEFPFPIVRSCDQSKGRSELRKVSIIKLGDSRCHSLTHANWIHLSLFGLEQLHRPMKARLELKQAEPLGSPMY